MERVKKYNCLIVDDEPPAREVLRRYIAQIPMLNLVGECGNAIQALAALKQQQIDLLFLDIQMPQITGIDMIGTLIQPPKIVLTTAFEQYAVQAFELDVADYLIKPIRFDRFLKAVMKALPDQELSPVIQPVMLPVETADHAFLYFRAERKMVKVFLNDIFYVESLKDYIKIHTAKGTVITKYTMASLEAMLPVNFFLRVHRSFLVALNKIDTYTQDEIEIQEKHIPIGKLYRHQVINILTSTSS
ncbi:response regulator [Pedobacter chinensis]|uniref:Response regulator n=1 Tax=Pedobacter chinensis TaxID=2282421 RepID=A0A369Q0U8_9SPHI|nr:response regulator [Pedobacter chinensis]RDC56626.1 response regulator [Pedobacter chinensis]